MLLCVCRRERTQGKTKNKMTNEINTHTNKAGETYYSMENEAGETIYSFTSDFEDTWDQETQDEYGE